MVIDTSAIVAILQREPEADAFIAAIAHDSVRLVSAASMAEAGIVIEQRFGFDAGRDLDDFLREAGVEIVPVDAEQAREARRAFRAYGRGNHPARLNFGDCFALALAAATGEALLFKGDDFARTGVATVRIE